MEVKKPFGDVTITAKDGGTFTNGLATITVAVSELGNVLYTPPAYTHGKFDFDISYSMKDENLFASGNDVVTNVDKSFSINLASEVDEVSVEINPISDTVAEGQELPLGLTLTQVDSDGSEISSVVITGVPEGAIIEGATIKTLQDGTKEFVLKVEDVAGAKIIADPTYSGTFILNAKALSFDIESGGIFTSSSVSKEYTITPVASDILSLSIEGWEGEKNSAISLNLDLVLEDFDTYSDSHETLNIVITNYEAGSTFSIDGTTVIGEDKGNGNYEIEGLSPEEAEKLFIIPPKNFSGLMQDVQISLKTKDGEDILTTAKTDSFTIIVNDEENFVINDITANKIENTNTYELNISANLSVADQNLDIVLSNVQGTLNNGTFDSDSNTWTLSKSDLTGLTFTPANDADDNLDIQVQAITTDDSGEAKTVSTKTISVDTNETVSLLDVEGEIDLTTITETNLDAINLENSKNNSVNLKDINLDEIVDLTDDDNELKIFGEDGDQIFLEGGTNTWTNEGKETIDGKDFDVYKGTDGTSNIKILIDEDVSVDPDL